VPKLVCPTTKNVKYSENSALCQVTIEQHASRKSCSVLTRRNVDWCEHWHIDSHEGDIPSVYGRLSRPQEAVTLQSTAIANKTGSNPRWHHHVSKPWGNPLRRPQEILSLFGSSAVEFLAINPQNTTCHLQTTVLNEHIHMRHFGSYLASIRRGNSQHTLWKGTDKHESDW
jgi:hypothetical protein